MPVFTLFDRHCGTVKLHGVLAGIVMLGACVRVFRLSHFSLWNDELFTRFYPAVFDTAFLWKEGFWLESNPPLFYTLMAGWMHVFGTSEAGLRSFSVVASVVHIPLVYVLGREICSRRVGLIAALLCAFSPISIYFAQEARTYALLSVTTTIALISITRLIGECRRSDSGLPHPSASQKWALVYYALSALLAIYLHATMSIFVLSCAIGVTAVLLASGQTWARRIVLVWLSVNALVLKLLPSDIKCILMP
jgi:mannosyltransferase